MRVLIALFLVLLSSYLFSIPTYAAKPRIRRPTASRTAGVSYSSVRLSRSTNSIIVTFPRLDLVTRVTYTLSYVASGVPQGVVGTLAASGQTTDSRDLYFGTCSYGVCTAHYNIRNVILLVETTLSGGGVHTKRYRIKW